MEQFNLLENVKIYKTKTNDELIACLINIYLEYEFEFYIFEMIKFIKWARKDNELFNWILEKTKDIIKVYNKKHNEYDILVGAIFSIGMVDKTFDIENPMYKKYMREMREVLL